MIEHFLTNDVIIVFNKLDSHGLVVRTLVQNSTMEVFLSKLIFHKYHDTETLVLQLFTGEQNLVMFHRTFILHYNSHGKQRGNLKYPTHFNFVGILLISLLFAI